ncbi:hypothetical protein EMEDMD4_1190021 [Sinorhizobium medicae]|uniref:Uncharacterized protein n=1 Tax=Sinorhizobium medicae TaxID=110321 RepID=A0A508WSB8_9HYPH|nr:hypothetical protein EMEDMD4_1190021 [Sinorhizobium medicae]
MTLMVLMGNLLIGEKMGSDNFLL